MGRQHHVQESWTSAVMVCSSVCPFRGNLATEAPHDAHEPLRVAGPTTARTGRRMARWPFPRGSHRTSRYTAGAHFDSTASAHERPHAGSSGDTGRPPRKPLSVTVSGPEKPRRAFHGSASGIGPGAAIGVCGAISSTAGGRGTGILADTPRRRALALRDIFEHSGHLLVWPSLVRLSGRNSESRNVSPQSAHVFMIEPLRGRRKQGSPAAGT